jgi:hypothetical protein
LTKPILVFLALVPAVFWTGCGGGGNNSGGGNSGNNGGGGTGAVNPPAVVSVSAGQTTPGVNIIVPTPASSPAPNATLVGANGSQAFSSGDVLHRNSAATVIVAGTGLNTSMKASFSGPADIAIGPLRSITFMNNSKGISFTATVPSNAALGARTLILQDVNNDITTFAGGLEVIP